MARKATRRTRRTTRTTRRKSTRKATRRTTRRKSVRKATRRKTTRRKTTGKKLSAADARKIKKNIRDLQKATQQYMAAVVDLARMHGPRAMKRVKPHLMGLAKHIHNAPLRRRR